MSVVDATYPSENFSHLGCTRPEMEFQADADSGLLLPVSLVRGKADVPVAKNFRIRRRLSTDNEAWMIQVLHFHLFSVRGSHIRFELPSPPFTVRNLPEAALSSDQYCLFTSSQFSKSVLLPPCPLVAISPFKTRSSLLSRDHSVFTSRDTALQPPTRYPQVFIHKTTGRVCDSNLKQWQYTITERW